MTNIDVAAEAITDELQANSRSVIFTTDDGDEEEGCGFDVAEDTVASWLAPRALDAIDPRLKDLTPEMVGELFRWAAYGVTGINPEESFHSDWQYDLANFLDGQTR